MKKLSTLILLFISITFIVQAQNSETIKLTDLAAPKSPGFQLIDIAPTNIEAPKTPKSFVLGVIQSYDGSIGWPQSYSMETAPYWWLKKGGRNAYKILGLKTKNVAGS